VLITVGNSLLDLDEGDALGYWQFRRRVQKAPRELRGFWFGGVGHPARGLPGACSRTFIDGAFQLLLHSVRLAGVEQSNVIDTAS